jgi:hypothetical protein
MQVLILVYMSLVFMMYVFFVNPFSSSKKNNIEKINEMCVFLSAEMLMFFTDMLSPVQ